MTRTKNKYEIRPNANQINNIYVQTRNIGFVGKVPSTSATDRESMKPVRETWMFHPLCCFRMVCRSAFTLCRPNNGTLKKNVERSKTSFNTLFRVTLFHNIVSVARWIVHPFRRLSPNFGRNFRSEENRLCSPVVERRLRRKISSGPAVRLRSIF